MLRIITELIELLKAYLQAKKKSGIENEKKANVSDPAGFFVDKYAGMR